METEIYNLTGGLWIAGAVVAQAVLGKLYYW